MTEVPPVYLNAEQTEKFVFFMKHFDFIDRLQRDGVFALKNGSVIIDVDGNGKISRTQVTKVYN